MTTASEPPFSARNRGAFRQIDSDFPKSARIGLLHLLHDLVQKNYVGGWVQIAIELERISRSTPTYYQLGDSYTKSRSDSEAYLMEMTWDKVYDFCERLHGYLAKDNEYSEDGDNFVRVLTPKSEVQAYITGELQRLFVEEGLAFEFRDGTVQRQGRRHTSEKVSRAQVVLGDSRLTDARKHFSKALQFFRDRSATDYENAVKEAVCTVEAAGKALFPDAKAATLSDLVKWLVSNRDLNVPKALGKTFEGIYGYRSGGDGVAHGGTVGGPATVEVAEYVIAVCASQVIYLVDLANSQDVEVPF